MHGEVTDSNQGPLHSSQVCYNFSHLRLVPLPQGRKPLFFLWNCSFLRCIYVNIPLQIDDISNAKNSYLPIILTYVDKYPFRYICLNHAPDYTSVHLSYFQVNILCCQLRLSTHVSKSGLGGGGEGGQRGVLIQEPLTLSSSCTMAPCIPIHSRAPPAWLPAYQASKTTPGFLCKIKTMIPYIVMSYVMVFKEDPHKFYHLLLFFSSSSRYWPFIFTKVYFSISLWIF
jgi:hypothetical protein